MQKYDLILNYETFTVGIFYKMGFSNEGKEEPNQIRACSTVKKTWECFAGLEKDRIFAALRQGQHLCKVARFNFLIKQSVKVSCVSNGMQQMAIALVLTAPTYGLYFL